MTSPLIHSHPIPAKQAKIIYSEHPYRFNRSISIDPELQKERILYLSSMNFTLIVSLDLRKTESIKNQLPYSIQRLEYPLLDTINKPKETISLEKINEIWNLCKKFLESNHKILIHCGSGNGRTSVVVASLLLRMEYKTDPTQFKLKNQSPPNTLQTVISSYDEATRECSNSIKEIIDELRNNYFNFKAIETVGQIDTLIGLCRHLLTEGNIFDQ